MVANVSWTWQLEDGRPTLSPAGTPSGVHLAFWGRNSPETPCAWMDQVHGTRVRKVDEPGAVDACDGLITDRAALPLRIKTADCLPVILFRPGLLGVCHAGWRGLAAGVIEEAVSAMGRAGRIHAWIGPAIGPCCYEVGPEVARRFPRSMRADKPHLDLLREARLRLEGAGISGIQAAGVCTRCHQHLLYSHRGSAGSGGRNLSYAVLI